MEDSQTAQSGNSGKLKLQRYPLRSATKSKEKSMDSSELSNSTASKRVRATSSVSKSVSVLDLSGKEKSAKPPRRLSIPTKTTPSPAPRPPSAITPISEIRTKRIDSAQRKPGTSVFDASKSSSRKKFSVLSSSSYWISQIKLSEAAAKHSISIGFFKLALEAGCEPLQRMRDELSSYVRRNNLDELGDSLKELSESYDAVLESTQVQSQVSETISQVAHEEETRSSDDEVRSSSSTVSSKKPKPKAVTNTSAAKATPVSGSTKKSTSLNTNPATARTRVSLTKSSANSRSVKETKPFKKPQKSIKQEIGNEKDLIKKKGNKSAVVEAPVSPSANDVLQENKENMEASSVEETNLIEVI